MKAHASAVRLLLPVVPEPVFSLLLNLHQAAFLAPISDTTAGVFPSAVIGTVAAVTSLIGVCP